MTAGGVLGAIGDTPLVRFERILPGSPLRIYAKLEALNPGGSAKDRSATKIMADAVASGAAVPGQTVVVESSSGNFAIGLAQACRYFGLDLICVVDPTVTPQNLAILRAYGATIEMVRDDIGSAGSYLAARVRRVREILSCLPSTYWPNQYDNPLNPAAYASTMSEIVHALGAQGATPDYVFCPVGTCGTLRGCADYIRGRAMTTRLVAVDAVGSVIFGLPAQRRLIPGHGASLRPGHFAPGLADDVVHVTDWESVVGCHRLVQREAYLAGGSSGAVVAAVEKLSADIPPGSHCVLILPDRGERYLDTIYSADWIRERFGSLPDEIVESFRPIPAAASATEGAGC